MDWVLPSASVLVRCPLGFKLSPFLCPHPPSLSRPTALSLQHLQGAGSAGTVMKQLASPALVSLSSPDRGEWPLPTHSDMGSSVWVKFLLLRPLAHIHFLCFLQSPPSH